jgi:hypothetical protein
MTRRNGGALDLPRAGRRSLKKYEIANLFFFVAIIVALGVMVTFVFRYYGTRNQPRVSEPDLGVISDALSDGSDVGLFYLGTKLSETSHQYRSRLDIPVTDDGLLKELFSLPGVEEITLDQRIIIIKKTVSVRWENIQPGVRRIVRSHLHIHY